MNQTVAILAVLWLPIVHLIGDYVFQNYWMATRKAFEVLPAIVHVTCYTSVYLIYFWAFELMGMPDVGLLTKILWIGVTHFFIDHFQLPALFSFVANGYLLHSYQYQGKSYQLFPDGLSIGAVRFALYTKRWATLPPPVPPFVILTIDQTLHLICNAIVLSMALLS